MNPDRLKRNEGLSDSRLIQAMRQRKSVGKPVAEIVRALSHRRNVRRIANQGDSTIDLQSRLKIRQQRGQPVTEIRNELNRRAR